MRDTNRPRASLGTKRILEGLTACLLALFLAAMPAAPARAAVSLTKDGIASAEKADCVIDADSLRDLTFSTTNENFQLKRDAGTYQEKTNGAEHYIFGVYLWHLPKAGETSVPGSFELVWKNALLDSTGNRHDLHARFSNIRIKWSRDPNVGQVSQQIISVSSTAIRIIAEPGALIRWDSTARAYKSVYDAWETTTVNAMGMSCDVTFWNGDATRLKYNLFARDLDQPDRFTGNTIAECSFGSTWAESFAPASSFTKFHVHKSTWLGTDGSRIYGSHTDDDEEQNRSAFVSLGTMGGSSSPLKFTWKGSMCSTNILQDWSYTLKTRVIGGVGGTIYTKTGRSVGIKENTTATWNTTGTVPKNDYLVTATPEDGYHITGMWLDGKRVSASEIAAGSVSVPNVGANHTVSVQFAKEAPKTGSLSLSKTSSVPSITEGNACYSLEGAEYGVYTDEACTSLVGSLVTDEHGASNELDLEAATYYVRELHAPSGYALDSQTHAVDVVAGQAATLELQETPLCSSIDVLVQKTDADTDAATPQGSASLAGAEFTVRYYAEYADRENLPSDATRSWVIKTDSEGKARLTDAQKVSGDDFYLLSETPVIPLGTLSIQETKAPEGYLLPEIQPVIEHVNAAASEEGDVPTQEVTLQTLRVQDAPARGGVRLKKTNRAGDTPLGGAVFAIKNESDSPVFVGGTAYAKGDVCLTIQSGADGIAETSERALPYGTYTIAEQQAPTGYATDTSWSETVAITQDGEVVDLLGHPVRNDRITTSVVLKATKTFDGSSQGMTLTEGMFSFALSDDSGNVLQTKTNDASGNVTFDALAFDYTDLEQEHTYTIVETPGEDDAVIYDSHTETVRITLEKQPDGSIQADVETDDDGIAFHNSTVPAVDLPLTGRTGIASAGLGTLIAAVSSSLFALRTRTTRRRT